jgi:hypothetical protein
VTLEAKELVLLAQPSVLVAGYQGTVAHPSDSGVAFHLVESVSSPAEFLCQLWQ